MAASNTQAEAGGKSLVGWEIDEKTNSGAQALTQAFLSSVKIEKRRPKVNMIKGSTMDAYSVHGTVEKTTGALFTLNALLVRVFAELERLTMAFSLCRRVLSPFLSWLTQMTGGQGAWPDLCRKVASDGERLDFVFSDSGEGTSWKLSSGTEWVGPVLLTTWGDQILLQSHSLLVPLADYPFHPTPTLHTHTNRLRKSSTLRETFASRVTCVSTMCTSTGRSTGRTGTSTQCTLRCSSRQSGIWW